VKYCQFIASLYQHIITNFGQFIFIFNKIALIFLTYSLYHFTFQQFRLLWLHR